MKRQVKKLADQFTPGFYDDRMVAQDAEIVYKHVKKLAKKIKKEAYQRNGRNTLLILNTTVEKWGHTPLFFWLTQ